MVARITIIKKRERRAGGIKLASGYGEGGGSPLYCIKCLARKEKHSKKVVHIQKCERSGQTT